MIHMKDDDRPDQGVSGRSRNAGTRREMGHRKVCKWVGMQVHGERWDIGKYVSG